MTQDQRIITTTDDSMGPHVHCGSWWTLSLHSATVRYVSDDPRYRYYQRTQTLHTWWHDRMTQRIDRRV